MVASFTFFCLGAICASFVGVASARLNTGHSIVRGRSRCDVCDTHIPPIMLVPVLSYLFSGGRARCCGSQLALWSPATELLLGLLFVQGYMKLGFGFELLLLLAALCVLLALVLYDLQHQILPPVLLYSFVALATVFGFFTSTSREAFQTTFLVALGVGLFFLVLHYGSRGRAMGFADAPLAFGLATLVGSELAFAGLAYSFWIGSVVGITILLRRPKGSRIGIEVPFAPFLAAGFLLAYFFIPWNPLALLAPL